MEAMATKVVERNDLKRVLFPVLLPMQRKQLQALKGHPCHNQHIFLHLPIQNALNGLEDVGGCVGCGIDDPCWHGVVSIAWAVGREVPLHGQQDGKFHCMSSRTRRRAPLRSLFSTSFVAMASIRIGGPMFHS
ncbi:unnamed protein product [Prunus armeniaca]|uniref:Uncharacterized protein n=1 Tax=Prunus armeniaca TaxID=36596 RepID=A0A6J5VBS6_PRUAR|nr:unnamed protein product [Prunus armeniaca]